MKEEPRMTVVHQAERLPVHMGAHQKSSEKTSQKLKLITYLMIV